MVTNIQRSEMASGNNDDLLVRVIEDKEEKFKVNYVG